MERGMETNLPAAPHFQTAGARADSLHEAVGIAARESFRHSVVSGSLGDVPVMPSIAVMLAEINACWRRILDSGGRTKPAGLRRERSRQHRKDAAGKIERACDAALSAMRTAPAERAKWWCVGSLAAEIFRAEGVDIAAGQVGIVMKRAVDAGLAVAAERRGKRVWKLTKAGGAK